ncbi:MAG TPA: hypothetical protein VFO70_03300 [Chitinophagaceae bacterium]|nr:hypothetical protein [Chitinophagaceae bacterium]
MKWYLIIMFVCTFSVLRGQEKQNGVCAPDTSIGVMLCYSQFRMDTLCLPCTNCLARLVSSNESFAIMNYKVTILHPCQSKETILERTNEGEPLHASMVATKICPGSIIKFGCIKAKHHNGKTYILQPLVIKP